MRIGLVLGVLGALVIVSCIVTSGQFSISFDLDDPLEISGPAAVIRVPIDLTTISDYVLHKDDLSDILDAALLGKIENTGAEALEVEFWMTPGSTRHATAAQVRDDPTARLVWGPMTLEPRSSRRLDWDSSAALFVGRRVLFDEVRADGRFQLFVLGPSSGSPYTIRLRQGVLVLMLDAGI
jgi:hypothetical protein